MDKKELGDKKDICYVSHSCHKQVAKSNSCIVMNGLTHYQKFKASNSMTHHHVLKLPTILMEHLFKFSFNHFNDTILKSTGQNVYTKYL